MSDRSNYNDLVSELNSGDWALPDGDCVWAADFIKLGGQAGFPAHFK